MASLGSTVSTRADTAARHMQACRVNYEHLSLMSEASESEIITNKYKYCMHKDELAVSLSKPMFANESMVSSQKYPYPAVVSTLGDIHNEVQNFICYSNDISSNINYDQLLEARKQLVSPVHKNQVQNLRDYIPVGYSVGLAYAHATSGDNMASVMIGGVVTIPNGHFAMSTGDMVQFYWDFEQSMFDPDTGARNDTNYPVAGGANHQYPLPVPITDASSTKRQRFQDKRINGMNPDTRKKNVPMIKPFVRRKGKQVFADSSRVFAKCISCARPFDMVDILISRQAM
jgi:hypothetical protein